jgi:hypothetical protein
VNGRIDLHRASWSRGRSRRGAVSCGPSCRPAASRNIFMSGRSRVFRGPGWCGQQKLKLAGLHWEIYDETGPVPQTSMNALLA